MEQQPEWKGRVNQKDQDGCTVLHVVAAHSPGYLIKRKWRHRVQGKLWAGGPQALATSLTRPLCFPRPSCDGLRSKLCLELNMIRRISCVQRGGGAGEGRIAGLSALNGFCGVE